MTARVTLYSRPGCHLCEDLKTALAALDGDIAFELVECNIEDDPAAMARFRYLIPVLDIEQGPLLYPPHDWAVLVEALRAAERKAKGLN
jgi:glutaredoxin